jgi:hypothetical protein
VRKIRRQRLESEKLPPGEVELADLRKEDMRLERPDVPQNAPLDGVDPLDSSFGAFTARNTYPRKMVSTQPSATL